jgi:serine/threonine protein kinase
MSIINKKYRILNKIGDGSFGSIYKGINIRTNENVAIKVEIIDDEIKLLKNESIIYQYLANNIGIPTIKWFGKDDVNYYMVINLLGSSLQKLKDVNGNFSLKLTLQVGIQIINLLKIIHNSYLVHRDIKPENFLLGLNDQCKQIFIIDFGFCKSLKREIEVKKTSSLIGSYTYASINAHNFLELTRRDDLESLGYMLIYLSTGKLKWQDYDSKLVDINKNKIISQMKMEIIENKDIPEIFISYLKYVRSLGFNQIPDYTILLETFNEKILSLC